MILTIFVGALAACGIIMILWAMMEALLMPIPRDSCHIFYLHGTDAQVEQQVRSCRWLKERKGLNGKILLVDCGLSPQAQMTVQLMLEQDDTIQLCAQTQIADYLRMENGTIGAGTT